MNKIYTLKQAADMLETTERYLSDNYKAGKLKAYKMGKRVYLLHNDLVDFIQLHPYKISKK